MDLWQLLGDLHPKLVHFPLVLLLAGLLFDLSGLVARSERCHFAAKILTAAGTVTLLISFICGIYAEIWAGRALVPHHQIELHELAANVASWGFVILAAWRLLIRSEQRVALSTYVIIGLVWYVLLVGTAYLGGLLITDYGASVTGLRDTPTPSLHDLNTLATRQTDLNLRYSEMMHHIFGYLTLALSGSLLAAAAFPRHAGKLKWVGPTLLLFGGIFLFFFADLDLYALTDPRQWRDREVQLHKTIALVLTIVGAAGLRAARRKAEPVPTFAATTPTAVQSTWTRYQAKLIAIMSLIGGGMLFTHVHTVAPYANVAAGVYVAHVTMGLVALAIGASALLGDAFPKRRGALAVVFALCMLTESVLLLTYNEGLPWYIGYGRYNRWGPNGGTIAPFGDYRAELTFDDATQRLQVQLLDRHKDEPIELKSPPSEVLISRGYRELAVPLVESGRGQFTGVAPFLRDVPAFSARMRIAGRTGYFDPWVTPVIAAVPPNEVARFACPMHEGIRSAAAGTCKLCGMTLISLDASPRTALHDDGYEMAFTTMTTPSPLAMTLQLTPKRSGAALTNLAKVHEYLMHLIVVSEDLSFFDHVHPTPQPDGAFTLPYTFPSAGRYVLFADITPGDARSQVFRLPIAVGDAGRETSPKELQPSPAFAKPLAVDPTLTAELIPTPRKLTAATHAQLEFRLEQNGKPITDLEPYIGAMGHCVIVSDDGQLYLHSHPEQLFPPKPDAKGGPAVAFHTRFPKPGRYKIWGQFKRGEKVIIADFVVDVAPSILPAPLMSFFFDQ